jgi:hypothetical protein
MAKLTAKEKDAIEVAVGSKDGVTSTSNAIDGAARAAVVAAIAVPGTATAADCANKINEILAALVAGGSSS